MFQSLLSIYTHLGAISKTVERTEATLSSKGLSSTISGINGRGVVSMSRGITRQFAEEDVKYRSFVVDLTYKEL